MSHLCLGDDGTVLWRRLVQRGEGRGQDEGVGSDEACKVAAGDVVLFPLHHHRVHHVEDVPGEPHGAVQRGERGALVTQSQRGSAVRQEVEPTTQISGNNTEWMNCIMCNKQTVLNT